MDFLLKKYEKRAIRGDLYSIGNLKALLDDLMNEYLQKIGYKRNYLYTDIKNIIGILSTIIAGLTCFISVNYKFNETKTYLCYLVFAYFLINSVYFIVNYGQENKYTYDSLSVATRTADDVADYIILIYWKDKLVPVKYNKSLFDLFDDSGKMDHILFLNDLDRIFNQKK